ncbi:MAG: tetratricopeptide repeat protein [Proteobacteria bacterium]|nr:tetratricopeptide repeat protein [Pseudomonadota bacterium]
MMVLVPLLLVLGVLLSATPESRAMSGVDAGAPALTVAQERVQPAQVDAAAVDGIAAYLQGAILDLDGRPERAAGRYLAALAEDPDNLALRGRALEILLLGGDVPNAVKLAKTLPAVNQTTLSRLAQVVQLGQQGKIKQSRSEMRRLLKQAPTLWPFLLTDAYLQYADGVKPEVLVRRLNQLPLASVLEGRRQYHVGRLWLKAGQPAKALAALARAQQLEPASIFTTLLLAETLARQGQVEQATALLADFAGRNPAVELLMPDLGRAPLPPFAASTSDDLAAAVFDFGLLVWGEGALGPARQLLNMALWLAPEQGYYRYFLAILLEMGEDWDGAAQEYARLMTDPLLHDGAKLRLAEVRMRQGDAGLAWQLIGELQRARPAAHVVRRSVAQMAFDRGDYNRAAEEYGWLMDRLPASMLPAAKVELLFARGAAYERDRDFGRAEKDLRAALQLAPNNPQILNYLAYMLIERGQNLAEALAMLQKAHVLAPRDGAITDSLGWAYFKMDKLGPALKYLELAAEQEPESPEILSHLGDAYAKAGRLEDARKYWQRALDLLEKGVEEPFEGFGRQLRRKL